MGGALSERALIVTPHGRDAGIATAMLAEAGIASAPCPTVGAMTSALTNGAGFVLVTEEVLATADLSALSAWLAAQEEWSDFPFILLTTRGGGLERNPAAARFLSVLGNVTFLERPFHPTTLISLAQAALRARRRQYEARARLIELHLGAERYRSLFETIDAGFCIIDVIFDADRAVDYRFVEVNPAFVRQTGLAEAVGRRVSALMPGHERLWAARYGRVARTGEPLRAEVEAKTLGRWYDVHVFRVGDPSAERVAALFNDITPRRRVEQELRTLTASLEQRIAAGTAEREVVLAQLHEAQKLETLGQLTGGVAHDFNNLLTPITGVLDLMQRRYGSTDERAGRLIGGAIESAERARTLVQRLLGFARRQALQTRPVDMAALLDGMSDLVANSVGATVELRIRCAADLPPALVDPNQLELALLNLCVNARDAMPDGGQLTITADTMTLGPDAVTSALSGLTAGSYVRLSVIDTGFGMDEVTRSRAVEPFYSTKEIGKGTGLGLSMVHGLASQLGGGFGLTSAPGKGTRIDLWLPVTTGEAAPRAPVADMVPARVRPLSILLVDDEPLVRSATAEMMREIGHQVTEATSGADALNKLAGTLAKRDPDLIVTDYKMPRMNGAELAERVRTLRPGVPVLLITGYTGPAQDAPDLPRLDKPFRRTQLAAAIEQVVEPARTVVALHGRPRR